MTVKLLRDIVIFRVIDQQHNQTIQISACHLSDWVRIQIQKLGEFGKLPVRVQSLENVQFKNYQERMTFWLHYHKESPLFDHKTIPDLGTGEAL